MKINHKIIGLFLSCAVLLTGTSAALAEGDTGAQASDDYKKEGPSATLELKNKELRLILGGSWGGGTLDFQGKTYKFKISGLSAGGVGFTNIDAVGKVYRLKSLEDFNGRYNAGSIGITVAKGKGGSTLENAKGVIIDLKQKSSGLALSLGISSLTIELEK